MARRFTVEPCPLTAANAEVVRLHRHAGPIPISQYNLLLRERRGNAAVVGTGILGLPLARPLNDGLTLEVRRTATDGTTHAPSAILGALSREARRRGALRVVSYTRVSESGASLRAAGFQLDERLHRYWRFEGNRLVRLLRPSSPKSWNMPGRPRKEAKDLGEERLRWWWLAPEAFTEDAALQLGAAATRSGQRRDFNPYNAGPHSELWELWRESYDCPAAA